MDELAKLINDYSLSKHFADEMFVYNVCNILINKYEIFSYVKNIDIRKEEHPDCFGEYYDNLNKVNIYLDYIISEYSKLSLRFSLKDFEYYYYINLNVLKIIIHELNHAKQYKKLNSNINDEETFLYKICTRTLEEMYYTSNIHIKNSADYYNLLCLKDSLYIIDPMERMAEFKSLSNTRKLILNNDIIPQKINNIFSLTQTNLILKVHKNEYLSPTIKFLDEMKYEDDLNKFKFYNGVIDKEFLSSFSIYDYAKRIFYGYPITEEEYNVNREFKKYLIREIKK